jgi:hypothetical protein
LDQELDDRHLQEESGNGTSGGQSTGGNLWGSAVELLWLGWSTMIVSVRYSIGKMFKMTYAVPDG